MFSRTRSKRNKSRTRSKSRSITKTRSRQTPIFDIFQEGLIRGSEHLAFDPEKAYAYVEHPTEGWRVYLRSCGFVHVDGDPDKSHFLVVKKTGKPAYSYSWEPPKGQMEGKDLGRSKPITHYLLENVRREMEEEAAIKNITSIRHTGLIYQNQEKTYPPNWYFQYHIYEVTISEDELRRIAEHFKWIAEHPKGFARFKRDRREKDAIAFYNPKMKIYGSWAPGIIKMYLESSSQQHGGNKFAVGARIKMRYVPEIVGTIVEIKGPMYFIKWDATGKVGSLMEEQLLGINEANKNNSNVEFNF